jgi:hypothetical protein
MLIASLANHWNNVYELNRAACITGFLLTVEIGRGRFLLSLPW